MATQKTNEVKVVTVVPVAQTQTVKVEPSTGGKILDVIQPFVIGGLSGMFATCIIQPIDMIKVSIQLKS